MASHRRPAHPGCNRTVRVTVLSAAVATAAAALSAAPASARPGPAGDATGTVKEQIDRLYEQAERATEKFNAADERAGALRRKVEQAADRVARGQEKVNAMRTALGMVASAQYRAGAVDPALRLLLSSDPERYLDRASVLDRVTGRQAGQLHALLAAQRALTQERAEAGRTLAELEEGRRAVARHKREVEGKLAAARRLLNSLPDQERQDYARASRSGGGAERPGSLPPLSRLAASLPGGGDAAAAVGASSSRGAAAAMAARSAVGTPYAWGATGPSAFDCSGLMQWAYGRAGVGLPRTSQAQRNAGRHVSLSDARPGDLVIYRDDASHVGMYVGNGQVVHAPYPGARVRYDPANMMPISSITRP
ncbi:C40 family peptidase [Streptomyces sp. AV19]|uniref:C40 family peptidase n=1 Tax=Streptomyces sp. AV19 TaxID=2793068 RepID=UPI0018FEF9D4|nr:C40 family peptidase [Streptomyces sp. AV19]MBH1936784.1 C40 family peptidase [Streptomyces sp. AV19]MDG4532240.1 NlpC/P60 family protein [Streptomyces sp. AV19]